MANTGLSNHSSACRQNPVHSLANKWHAFYTKSSVICAFFLKVKEQESARKHRERSVVSFRIFQVTLSLVDVVFI